MAARRYEKQMGITHAEFFRLLPIALGTDAFTRTPDGVAWHAGPLSGSVILGLESKRRIALLAVPSTPVTIELEGYDDEAAKTFMARFDRAYQRGGG